MSNEIRLGLVGLIPVAVSLILYYVDVKFMNEVSKVKKQIIYGLILGGVSVLGSELGVQISGAIMNVRDAAPLCAGLIFGPISGVIAGVIGGVERYYAVLWGAGTFTRVACSVSTFLAGVYAAVLNKYVFDGKLPGSIYGLAAGFITEVSHMMMVFATHSNEVEKSYDVVRVCTAPMMLVNGFSVMLAIVLVRYFFEIKDKNNSKKKTISELFQSKVLIVCLVGFVLTTFFNYILEIRLAYKECDDVLSLNIADVKQTVDNASDQNLLNTTRKIANEIERQSTVTNEYLKELASTFEVYEISKVSNTGIIEYSTEDSFVDFDFNSGKQSQEFLCLLNGQQTHVQSYQPISYDVSIYRKYAGVALANGGFIQVGLDENNFRTALAKEITQACNNRHIGNSGSLIIADSYKNIASDLEGSVNKKLSDIGLDDSLVELEENVRHKAVINGQDVFFQYTTAESYYIIAFMPQEEALSSAHISLYLSSFLEVIVFTGLFLNVYFVVRNLIVRNINKTNDSLKLITEGKLDTVVDVKTDIEFESLSNGINTTVNRLKEYIKEANERIEAELKYASEIQHSALPNTFPAFPDHDEFDIHATMNAAKSVGGDFYDFYIVDGNKLVMLMADVSGKGIPAALFMMRAKTLMKSYAEYGISSNDVFTNANYNLCEGNEQGLFVTAWIGVLDLVTGNMKYANAGHNPPLIKRKDGQYEYLRSKPGFVLGGMEGIVFKEFEMDLNAGDEIYLYTDGVTESQNLAQELYGEDRLLDILNTCEGKTCEEICQIVKEDVDKFVGEADQFDDLTMLSFKLNKL